MNGPARPIDAASAYARRGWPVFPCHTVQAGACTCLHDVCGSPGKHPLVRNGLHDATTDLQTIRTWWGSWPRANIAIRTGQPAGLVVLDIDPDHGGQTTLDRIVDEHGPLPPARMIRTGSGGLHLYFAHPGHPVPNDAGRRLGPGIDIRGDGGYVIAPPSRHRSGDRYRLTARGGEIPHLPGWMIQALQPEPRPDPRPARRIAHRDAWAEAALTGELDRLRQAPAGARNDTLNRVAFRIGQIIGAGRLTEADAASALTATGQAIGLSQREADRTTWSGLLAGEAHPSPSDPP